MFGFHTGISFLLSGVVAVPPVTGVVTPEPAPVVVPGTITFSPKPGALISGADMLGLNTGSSVRLSGVVGEPPVVGVVTPAPAPVVVPGTITPEPIPGVVTPEAVCPVSGFQLGKGLDVVVKEPPALGVVTPVPAPVPGNGVTGEGFSTGLKGGVGKSDATMFGFQLGNGPVGITRELSVSVTGLA